MDFQEADSDWNVCERDFPPKIHFFSLKLLETHWKYDRSTIRAVSLCIHTASNKPHRIPSWQIGRACYSLFTQKPLCFLLLYFNTAELPTSKSKILPQDSQKGILKLSLESIFFLLISNFPALACPPSSQRPLPLGDKTHSFFRWVTASFQKVMWSWSHWFQNGLDEEIAVQCCGKNAV